MGKAITSDNWHTIPLTGIVLRRPLHNIVILSIYGEDGEPTWMRFDVSRFWEGWCERDTAEIVRDFITVEVRTDDIPQPVDPARL